LSLSVGAVCLAMGCDRPLGLGNDVIWSTDFESGNLSELFSPPGTGGSYVSFSEGPEAGAINPTLGISQDEAHSGHYSVKITSLANLPDPGTLPMGGGGVYKEGALPQSAYYTVWYYIPKAYVTTTNWIILRFRGVNDPEPAASGPLAKLLDLSLESQPDGTMTLILTDSRPQYLESPLPDPVPVVPVGRWFQIECFFRNANDESGRLTVWLDGAQIYDAQRPTGPNSAVYFTPCSLVYQMTPTDARLYVDDIAISYSRVTPGGVFAVPQ
jgi:hypothetical protein